jgi:hypothetical protein
MLNQNQPDAPCDRGETVDADLLAKAQRQRRQRDGAALASEGRLHLGEARDTVIQ